MYTSPTFDCCFESIESEQCCCKLRCLLDGGSVLQHQCIHVLIFSLSVIGKVASAAMVVCLNYVDKFELSIDSILFSKELCC